MQSCALSSTISSPRLCLYGVHTAKGYFATFVNVGGRQLVVLLLSSKCVGVTQQRVWTRFSANVHAVGMCSVSEISVLRSRRLVYCAIGGGRHLTEELFERQFSVAVARVKYYLQLEGTVGWVAKATKGRSSSGRRTRASVKVPERFSEFTVYVHLPQAVLPGRLREHARLAQPGWILREYARRLRQSPQQFFAEVTTGWQQAGCVERVLGPGLVPYSSGQAGMSKKYGGVKFVPDTEAEDESDDGATAKSVCSQDGKKGSLGKPSVPRRTVFRCPGKVHGGCSSGMIESGQGECLQREAGDSDSDADTIHVTVP